MNDPQVSSFLFRYILKSFGAGHPIRVGIGIAIAITAKMIIDGLAAAYPGPGFISKIAEYHAIWFMCVCIPLAFVPILIRGGNAPESVVETVNTMQAIINRAGMTRTNEMLFWRALLEKYVAAAKPDLTGSPDLRTMYEEAAQEFPKDIKPS